MTQLRIRRSIAERFRIPSLNMVSKSAAAVAFAATLAAAPLAAQDAATQKAGQTLSKSLADLSTSILGAKLRFSDGKVIVSHIKRGGVADRAGVRPGDQLQSIEKHEIHSLEDVTKVLQHFKPGDAVVMTVIPNSAPRQLYLAPPVPRPVASPAGGGMLGLSLNESSGGVVAGEVNMGGPAVVAGVRSGDRLISVDGQRITSRAQLLSLVNAHRPGHRVELTVQRGGRQRTLAVTLGARDRVAALPKMWVPSQSDAQQQAAPFVNVEDPNDEWADENEAEDIYNVNDRALYTDFD